MEKEFLTIAEAAEFFGWDPDTLKKKMSKGILRRGVHWFKREGEIGPRFDRAACVAWIREGKKSDDHSYEDHGQAVIPMARGYNIKLSNH
jgi:hypothetical protein